MARRFTRSAGRVGSSRLTIWTGIVATRTTLAAASTAAIMNVGSAGVLALRPFTIVRTRGYFSLQSDQTATGENFDAAIGFAVVSDQAVAIGVTAVPTPHTDLGSGLFFTHEASDGRFMFISGIGVHPQATKGRQYDSKAMRKVDSGQDVVFVAETSALSGGCILYHVGRMLIKTN